MRSARLRSAFLFSLVLGVCGKASGQIPTRAAAAAPEGDVPSYTFSAPGAETPSWLDFGFELRVRGEDRTLRLRSDREPGSPSGGFSRARLLALVAPESWPIRFTLEVQDARQFGTDFPATPATTNTIDVLQLRGDLELGRVFGAPIRIQAGRTSFDAIDRRLVARNRFRNTTNAFEGVRIRFGSPALGAEALALWPVERRPEELDGADRDRKLLGATGAIRRGPLSLEPYYLYAHASADLPVALHTAGVHFFGSLGERWDHDVHAAFQLGTAAGEKHRAFAFHGELGRSYQAAWNPRLAAWLNYASGDARPDDGKSGRFDPLFGASHVMYGLTDLFSWQNVVNPTAAVSLSPFANVRVQGFYRLYWLQSPRDAWVRAGLRDPTGESGSFVGQEVDFQLRFQVFSFAELDVQYGELFAGGFVKRTGGGTGARLLAAAVTLDLHR